MARRSRSRDLAGLAALGALGYTFFGPGRDRPKGASKAPVFEGRPVPVEEILRGRSADMPSPDADFPQAGGTLAPEDTSDFLSRRLRGVNEVGQATSMENIAPLERARVARAATPRAAADTTAAAYSDASRRRDVVPQSGAGAGRESQGGPTREEMLAQIPVGGTRTVEGGERVSGNEFTRNVGNILNAPVPGFVPVGRAVRGAAALRQPPEVVPALPAPQARLAGPSRGALKEAERTARQEQLRQQVLRENAANYGLDPTAPGYEAAMRALTRDLGGKDFTLRKKGGAVKAKSKKMSSGGMSSASKRADGIATKGKTKCKMY